MSREISPGERFLMLVQALGRSSDLYDQDEPGSDRAGSLDALIAVTDFLGAVDVEPPLLRPLKAIILAFGDANRGRTNRLFEVRRVAHRSPTAIEDQLAKVSAAIAMEFLMLGGRKQEDAAKTVAKAVRGWDIDSIRTQKVTWRTVKNWRDKLNAGNPADPDVKSFRALKAKFGQPGMDFIATAQAMMACPYRIQPDYKST